MAQSEQFGGTQGAIRVTSALPFTIPNDMVAYRIVPQPTWTGKAIADTGYTHMTADRTAGGAAITDTMTGIQCGVYTSVVVSTGAVDIYLRPKSGV